MKKMLKKTLPILMTAAVAMPTALTAAAAWGIDAEKYDEEIKTYAVELRNDTDRFTFYNGHYKKFQPDGYSSIAVVTEDDPNYIEFYKNSSNVVAAKDPLEAFKACIKGGLCLGISSLAVLSHNGIINPFDIQAGRENLIDIVADNDVMSLLLSYQTRQIRTDFKSLLNWSYSHYSDEERIDMLLEVAQKATEEGKYFLVLMTSNKYYNHAMVGIGMLDGEFINEGKVYDKCLLIYDSNATTNDETGKTVQCYTTCHSCIFINSKTRETYQPCYYDWDGTGEEVYSYFAMSDEDFINHNGKLNPSSDYQTVVPDINSIAIKSDSAYDLTLTRNDGTEYDGIAESRRILGTYEDGVYYCAGSSVYVKNTENANSFMANITNAQSYTASKFTGSVDNVFRDDTHFKFETNGETEYDVSLVFEEGSYDFSPHYRYDLSGVTDSDFSAKVTDRGIILSGSKGVKCTLKTSDIIRDEDGMIVSAEDNIWNDAIDTFGSVMVAFDEENKLKYYIGDNYDTEVQKGDVNCDGVIDSRDASILLTAYVNQSNDVSLVLGDYDENGVIDARDASAVLTYYVTGSN